MITTPPFNVLGRSLLANFGLLVFACLLSILVGRDSRTFLSKSYTRGLKVNISLLPSFSVMNLPKKILQKAITVPQNLTKVSKVIFTFMRYKYST